MPPNMQPTQGINPMAGQPPMQGGQAPAMRQPGPNEIQQVLSQLPPNVMEQMKAYIQSLPAEQQKEAIIKFATDYMQKGQQAQGEMTRSDELRRDQPRGTYARGMYVAASPLEHAATAMGNYKQRKAYEGAQERLGAATQGAQDVRAMELRRMTGN